MICDIYITSHLNIYNMYHVGLGFYLFALFSYKIKQTKQSKPTLQKPQILFSAFRSTFNFARFFFDFLQQSL